MWKVKRKTGVKYDPSVWFKTPLDVSRNPRKGGGEKKKPVSFSFTKRLIAPPPRAVQSRETALPSRGQLQRKEPRTVWRSTSTPQRAYFSEQTTTFLQTNVSYFFIKFNSHMWTFYWETLYSASSVIVCVVDFLVEHYVQTGKHRFSLTKPITCWRKPVGWVPWPSTLRQTRTDGEIDPFHRARILSTPTLFDNISFVITSKSDSCCRCSTGQKIGNKRLNVGCCCYYCCWGGGMISWESLFIS